jgi:hypothetical protein
MAPQWGRVLALCVLVMVAGQAHAQGGQPVNENVQYMSGSVLGPLYHSSDDILTRLNQMSRGPLPVRLVQWGLPQPAHLRLRAWRRPCSR